MEYGASDRIRFICYNSSPKVTSINFELGEEISEEISEEITEERLSVQC